MFKNKRNLSRVLRVHSSVFVCLFLFILPVSADSFLQYVGEAFVLPPPTAPSYNAEVNSWSYSSSSKHIEVTNKGTTSPGKAVITSYFSGTETIECFYSYTIYVNGYLHGGTGSIYHTVSCESNNISISAPRQTMQVGETMQMSYKFSKTIYDVAPEINWKSNSSAVNVGWDGTVYAAKPGEATITASSNLGGNVAEFRIKVEGIDPTSVSIPKSETVYAGESIELKAAFTPSNAYSTLTWYSTDPSIATVSAGKVYGKSEGQTTIYCVTANGITSNDCKVSVNYRTPTSITCTPSELSLPIGESRQLNYSVTPSNARYTVEWLSSDKSVATVSSSGLVTAVSTGRTTIKVRTDNGKVATCEVKVTSIDPTSVSIPKSETVYAGESIELKATFTPSNAHTTLTWHSTNPSVATVSDGTVYGKSEGQTTIYCVTANGITSNDCKVSVNYRTPTSITCTPSELSLPIGKSQQLKYTVTPSNARYTVEWLSSDKSVATVSSSGLVTAVSTGRATIKVRTDNGKVATCEVNVTEQQFYDLVVWLKNGEKNMFRLPEHPVVSYADGAFILKTSRTEAEYKGSSVRKFTLLDEKDDPAASVQEVKEKPNSHVYYSDDVVEMTGGKPNSRVNVYRLDGKRADTMETDAEGNLTFSVAQYPAGTYIIESETITFKISKR